MIYNYQEIKKYNSKDILNFINEESGVIGFLSESEVDFLYDVGKKNKKYLEIGSYKGLSALIVGLGMLSTGNIDDCEIQCIDTFESENEEFGESRGENTLPIFENGIKFFNLSNIIHINKGFSYDLFNNFQDEYFDFVFIDGDHSFEGSFLDYKNYYKKVKKGGILAFHDCRMAPGVDKTCLEIEKIHNIKKLDLRHTIGGFYING